LLRSPTLSPSVRGLVTIVLIIWISLIGFNLSGCYVVNHDPLLNPVGGDNFEGKACPRLANSFTKMITTLRAAGVKIPQTYERPPQLHSLTNPDPLAGVIFNLQAEVNIPSLEDASVFVNPQFVSSRSLVGRSLPPEMWEEIDKNQRQPNQPIEFTVASAKIVLDESSEPQDNCYPEEVSLQIYARLASNPNPYTKGVILKIFPGDIESGLIKFEPKKHSSILPQNQPPSTLEQVLKCVSEMKETERSNRYNKIKS